MATGTALERRRISSQGEAIEQVSDRRQGILARVIFNHAPPNRTLERDGYLVFTARMACSGASSTHETHLALSRHIGFPEEIMFVGVRCRARWWQPVQENTSGPRHAIVVSPLSRARAAPGTQSVRAG